MYIQVHFNNISYDLANMLNSNLNSNYSWKFKSYVTQNTFLVSGLFLLINNINLT